MKKGLIIGLILIAGILLVSVVYAQFPGKGYGLNRFSNVDIETVKEFQKETLPLRDELMIKRLEIQQEYGKENPDRERIATLEKEIVDIRIKIQKKADEIGLPARKGGRMGYGRMSGRGFAAERCAPCPIGR
ncbi:MAG: hypothetical protein HXY53_06685 [Nitrospirae bacterium]|nr:hypothetical protein [Nitrospirota bacterium]